MAARETKFVTGEFYHIYNRGVDKRSIFEDQLDLERFLQSLREFNTLEPIGSIYENSFEKSRLGRSASKSGRLVNAVAYCLNPNHYHFILEPMVERGIEKFMHRLGTGYAKYFNNKYKRSGALFQGEFKSSHINTNEYLLHLSVYVNLNFKVHKLGNSKIFKSSWPEYTDKNYPNKICSNKVILSQFKNAKAYQDFAFETLPLIIATKEDKKELESLLFD